MKEQFKIVLLKILVRIMPSHVLEYRRRILLLENILLFKKRGILFIHVPKSAGNSFHRGLYGVESIGHFTFKEYESYLSSNELKALFVFAIVRNPYDRMVSAYNYLKSGGRGMKNDLHYQKILNEYSSFEEFVLDFFSTPGKNDIEHFMPQSYWLEGMDGTIELDHVGYYENINEEYKYVFNQIKNQTEPFVALEKVNETMHKASHSFTKEMLVIVNDFYKKDFDAFNYRQEWNHR